MEGAERVGIRGLHLDRENTDLLELLKEHQIFPNPHINCKNEITL